MNVIKLNKMNEAFSIWAYIILNSASCLINLLHEQEKWQLIVSFIPDGAKIMMYHLLMSFWAHLLSKS